MKRYGLKIAAGLLPAILGLASCKVNVTHGEAADGMQSVSVELYCAEGRQETPEISDIRILIRGNAAAAETQAHRFGAPKELARKSFLLNEGDYRFVSVVNLSGCCEIGGTDGAVLSFSDLSANPEECFVGTTDARIGNSGHQVVRSGIAPFFPELTVELSEAEKVTGIEAEFLNMAAGVDLLDVDADGHGATTGGTAAGTRVPALTAEGGTVTTVAMRVLPTVREENFSAIRMNVEMNDGTSMKCSVEAPVMVQGGKYVLRLKVSELREYMRVNPCTIEGWTEGWTIDGAVPDPNN